MLVGSKGHVRVDGSVHIDHELAQEVWVEGEGTVESRLLFLDYRQMRRFEPSEVRQGTPVIAYGVTYHSLRECARALKLSTRSVSSMLRKGIFRTVPPSLLEGELWRTELWPSPPLHSLPPPGTLAFSNFGRLQTHNTTPRFPTHRSLRLDNVRYTTRHVFEQFWPQPILKEAFEAV